MLATLVSARCANHSVCLLASHPRTPAASSPSVKASLPDSAQLRTCIECELRAKGCETVNELPARPRVIVWCCTNGINREQALGISQRLTSRARLYVVVNANTSMPTCLQLRKCAMEPKHIVIVHPSFNANATHAIIVAQQAKRGGLVIDTSVAITTPPLPFDEPCKT